MRIISGSLGGRRIRPPSDMPHTRPTTDMAREGLFNVLAHQLDFSALRTLDLFAGTGCISFELYSRGVRDLTMIEKDPVMYQFIMKMIGEFGIIGSRVLRMDVFRFLAQNQETFDLVFAGPPYALREIDELPRLVCNEQVMKPGARFILEHTPRNEYKNFPWYESERKYGTTIFSFFMNPNSP